MDQFRDLKRAGIIVAIVVLLSLLGAYYTDGQEPDVIYVPEENLAFIRYGLVQTCAEFGCVQEDFFPFVHSNGTIASDAAIYWPRQGCAFAESEVPITCQAAIGYLTDADLNGGTLPVSIAGWCEPECRAVENFIDSNPIGSRIATNESTIPFAMDVPESVLLLVWRDGELEQHYGPKEDVILTPYSAWWHVNIVG